MLPSDSHALGEVKSNVVALKLSSPDCSGTILEIMGALGILDDVFAAIDGDSDNDIGS